MRHRLLHLIRDIERLRRELDVALSSFVSSGKFSDDQAADGSFKELSAGWKTHLRGLLYMRSRGIGDNEVNAIESHARTSFLQADEVTRAEKGVLASLLLSRVFPTEPVVRQFVVDRLSKVLAGDRYVPDRSGSLGYDLDHPIFMFHALQAALSTELPAMAQWCLRECALQVAYVRCGDTARFDLGRLCFALPVALSALPTGLRSDAIGTIARAIATDSTHELSAYRNPGKDSSHRPLLVEATAAALVAVRDSLAKRGEARPWENDLLDAVDFVYDVISQRKCVQGIRRDTVTDVAEAWSTIAACEFCTAALECLRELLFVSLVEEYDLSVSHESPSATALSKFEILPFDVARTIQANFVDGLRPRWRSAVLFGPPGTGKTSLARAVAEARGWRFVQVTPSELAIDGPSNIIRRARQLLASFALVERVVVLFDEFDLYIYSRDDKGPAKEYWHLLVTNAMLPLLQELHDGGTAIFFVATNYASKLDEAATRAGRFDALLPIWRPGSHGRRKLLESRNLGVDSELSLIIRNTQGMDRAQLLTSDLAELRKAVAPNDLEERWDTDLVYARPRVGKFD